MNPIFTEQKEPYVHIYISAFEDPLPYCTTAQKNDLHLMDTKRGFWHIREGDIYTNRLTFTQYKRM